MLSASILIYPVRSLLHNELMEPKPASTHVLPHSQLLLPPLLYHIVVTTSTTRPEVQECRYLILYEMLKVANMPVSFPTSIKGSSKS